MWTQLVFRTMLAISIVALAADGLSTTGDRDGRKLFGGYRITPKFCRASKTLPRSDPRSHGPTICMFNHECTQRQGEVVGACMDGFLFGACCQLQGSIDSSLVVEHELYQQSAAAQSYESYGNQQQQQNPSADQTNKVTVSHNSVEEPTHYADRPVLQAHNRPSTNSFGGLLDAQPNNQNHYGSATVEDESSNTVDGQLSNSNEDYPSPPKIVVDSNSVSVSSPSPEYGSSSSHITTSSYNTGSSTESYSTPTGSYISNLPTQNGELPTRIPTGTFSSTGGDSIIGSGPEGYEGFADAIMHIQSGDFTHSGITHPGVDAVIVDDGSTGYGNPTITVDRVNTPSSTAEPMQSSSTTTERTFKITHAKPLFRPKPTPVVQVNNTPDADKYVLIQTINHDVPVKVETSSSKPQGAMSVNDIESIESIILMLNDTKTGPQYNSDSSSAKPTGTGSTFYDHVEEHSNTASIYGVQGTTSQQRPSTVHYITEKVQLSTPKPPSTSYVYSPQPTKRPIQVQSTISSSFGAVQQDISPEHLNLPSSSEGYFPSPQVVPVTKRPILITSSSFATRLPTTGYIYTTHSTIRPTIQDDEPLTTVYTKKPTTSKVTKRPSPTTASTLLPKVPSPTTIQSPSTNFASATTIPPKRITKPTNKVNPTRKNSTETPLVSRPLYNFVSSSTPHPIVYEEIIQSKPLNQSPTSERPNPTVHITPKPTSNQVTSSVWPSPNTINHYSTPTIKTPTTSYVFVSTERPSFDYSTPDYSSGYGSPIDSSPTPPRPSTLNNQFDDPGYHGLSAPIRPEVHHQGSSASPPRPGFYGPTPPFGDEVQQFVEFSTIRDEVYTSQNDLNNFPPVRNPNLNTTSNAGHHPVNEYDISTPSFVEDEVLDDKMGILVSKIVQSLQGNFEQLADVVYDDVVQQDPLPVSSRPPANTKRPSGATTKKPTASTKRPAAVTSKPTARPSVATKKPNAATTVVTKKPIGTSTTPAKRTTKKPTPATTKKPVVTKVPSTRRPSTKPTKKVIPTTTVQQDEVVDEEEDEEDGEEEEISEEDAEQTTAFEEGRLQCGVRPQLKTGRIVGGKAAAFGEFPWQVLVRESTWLGLFTKNKCGGVLISKMYVMTAAHCQPGFLASLVTVFGEFDISGELEAKRSVTKNVRRVVVHRDYDASTFENDLALLELESAIHYDTHIVPICMPSDAAEFTGRVATVTGWGRLKYGGGVPTVMQEVQVPVIENSVCQEMFHTAGHNKKILPSFLCAGYANGQKDSCEGDSGGPLVIQRPDGRWELAGTVSHGIKCAAPYLPGVYMRTTFYKPWLKSITGVH